MTPTASNKMNIHEYSILAHLRSELATEYSLNNRPMNIHLRIFETLGFALKKEAFEADFEIIELAIRDAHSIKN